jgi:hypothetical protein
MGKKAYGPAALRFALTSNFPRWIIRAAWQHELDRMGIMLEQSTVPDFFQEETSDALRSQVEWLTLEIGLEDSFLAKLLETDEDTLMKWRLFDAELPAGREDAPRRFWYMTLHLLSFLNFDLHRVRELFQHAVPIRSKNEESALAPPWSGMSLTEYFERSRGDAVDKVDCWVTGLRFSDPYAAR